MPVQLSYPDINGLRPDWARVAINIQGIPGNPPIPTKGFRALSYKDKSNGEVVMHNAQLPAGQTSGQVVPDMASITMLLPEYTLFRAALAQSGFGAYTTLFNLYVAYSGVENGVPYSLSDALMGCRMAGSDNSHRHGGSALEVTVPVQPVYLMLNGTMPDDQADWAALRAASIRIAAQGGGSLSVSAGIGSLTGNLGGSLSGSLGGSLAGSLVGSLSF